MHTRKIETDTEYRATLHEIETLMDAAPSSKAEARLDLLATRVQVYEAEHYPIGEPQRSIETVSRMTTVTTERSTMEEDTTEHSTTE